MAARTGLREGQDTSGYYARIWQLRPEGWRLVSTIVPHRGPPPAD